VSPTWTAREAARAIPEVAAWPRPRLGDDRLRVGGICLHYGGDAEVARILHASQPYTGWAGFVESPTTAARTVPRPSWRPATACGEHARHALPA